MKSHKSNERKKERKKEREKERKKAPTIYESNKNMLQIEHTTMLILNMSRQWTSHSLLMLFCYY